MPGIVGIIRREPYPAMSRDVELMAETMRHEVKYVGNQYSNVDVGIGIAWQSHSGSLGEVMPLVSRDGRVVLVVSGEHFPERRASSMGVAPGSVGHSARDALRLYEELGEGFLSRLNGWFSGVVIDVSLGTVTLFNDRYGMGRIYFHENEEEFIFASEAKALLRVRPELRAIEPHALAEYFRFGCVMGNRTLFKGVSLLPGGSSWVFSGGAGCKKRNYFDFGEWEQQSTIESGAFFERFRETVSRVFPAYAESEHRVALSLTAGLDTRTILAATTEQNLPCYTFGGLWGETFDVRTARELAKVCHQTHEVIRLTEGFLRDFAGYASRSVYLSDGTHGAFGAHDVYFNRIARDIAPVRLTGKFGSEVVRNRRIIADGDFPRHVLQTGFEGALDEVRPFGMVSERRHPLSRAVSEAIAWYEWGRVSVEQSELTLRTPYMDNELVKLMYRATPEIRASRGLQQRFVGEMNHAFVEVPTDMGRMVDHPVGKLSYAFFRLLAKAEYIYLYSSPHWLTWLDRRMERLRPERIVVGRQKFEAYRVWIKTHLADFVRGTLLDPRARCTEFFDKAWLVRVVERHIAGTHNYRNEIEKMLTVELVYKTLLTP
jgi:asparagine synthase (glutamine-hydrolysing)